MPKIIIYIPREVKEEVLDLAPLRRRRLGDKIRKLIVAELKKANG